MLGWFREKDTTIFVAFLERWPTLPAAKKASRETLVDFFRHHNVRYAKTIERRIEAIQAEEPLHADPAVTEPALLLVEVLLPQLRAVSSAIERFDAQIEALAPQFRDYELFATLPGAGPTLAPRLLAAFGERRDRFPNASVITQNRPYRIA